MARRQEKETNHAQGRTHDRIRHHHRGGRTLNLLGAAVVGLCMGVYVLHRTVLPMEGSHLLNAHLHDLMAMPILLGWIDLIMDHRAPSARIYGSTRFAVMLTILGSFVWEIVVPAIDPTSVSDPVDALCYGLGAIGYLALRRRVLAQESRRRKARAATGGGRVSTARR